MGIWGWVAVIAAGWFILSVAVAAGYGLARYFTRTDEDRRREDESDLLSVVEATKQQSDDELLNALFREAFRRAQEKSAYAERGIEQIERYLGEVR